MLFHAVLAPVLFVVAAAYAAVGLGGGTAYLSVLSFWTLDMETLRPMAWGLNIVVTAVGIFNFARGGHLKLGLTWHYLAGAIGGGVVGAALPVSGVLFRWLLTATFVGLALLMFLPRRSGAEEGEGKRIAWPLGFLLGLGPGVLSGLVGIGGGIILGPLVLALGLFPAKRTAAMTAMCVLTVSAACLGTHFARGGTLPWREFGILSGVVLAGGFLGSRFGAGRMSPVWMRRLLGVILLAAAVNAVVKILAT